MPEVNTNVKDWIERVNNEGKGLTPWEENFMADVTDQFDQCGKLSVRQIEILEGIYAHRTK